MGKTFSVNAKTIWFEVVCGATETQTEHTFNVDMLREGPIDCPICGQRYIAHGGYTFEFRPTNYEGLPPRADRAR